MNIRRCTDQVLALEGVTLISLVISSTPIARQQDAENKAGHKPFQQYNLPRSSRSRCSQQEPRIFKEHSVNMRCSFGFSLRWVKHPSTDASRGIPVTAKAGLPFRLASGHRHPATIVAIDTPQQL
eukprot:4928265-Amphidinium_carterae.1